MVAISLTRYLAASGRLRLPLFIRCRERSASAVITVARRASIGRTARARMAGRTCAFTRKIDVRRVAAVRNIMTLFARYILVL